MHLWLSPQITQLGKITTHFFPIILAPRNTFAAFYFDSGNKFSTRDLESFLNEHRADKKTAAAGAQVSVGQKRGSWLRKPWACAQVPVLFASTTSVRFYTQSLLFTSSCGLFLLASVGPYSMALLCGRMSVLSWVLILTDGKFEGSMNVAFPQPEKWMWFCWLAINLI
jgi:hypothetical protein